MTKIHKLQNNSDYYYSKGVFYSDNGDYLKAIDYFYRAYSQDKAEERTGTLLEIGACYSMMGEHASALRAYYKALAFDPKNENVFVGIIASLIQLNRNSEAIYYINYSNAKNIIGDDYDVSVSVNKKFKVVGKYDRDATIFVARRLVQNGEIDYAKKLLEEIPPQSKDYIESLNLIALIYLRQEKFISCALVCDSVLEKAPDNVDALTTKTVALHYAKNFTQRDETVEILASIKVKKESQVRKIATCMLQIKSDAYSLKYFKKLLEFSPFDKDANLIVAILYHNMEKHDLAHLSMVKLSKAYPDCDVVKYYAQNLREESGKFEVICDIPQDEQERRFNEINETLSKLKTVERVVNYAKKHDDFYANLCWIITSKQTNVAGHISAFLAQSSYFHPLIREMLVEPNVEYQAKKQCLSTFLEFAQKKNFSIYAHDVVRFFKPRMPKIDTNHYFITAYYTAYANCVFFAYDFDKVLNKKYKEIAQKLSCISPECSVAITDANAIGALIVYTTKLHPIFSDKKAVCKLFGAKETNFDALVNLYENSEEKQ